MGPIEFIIRRTLRSFGIANERNHLQIASQQSQYFNEAEDMLGRIAWKDVGDVPELAEEYWKIKEIGTQQKKLEEEIKDIEQTNSVLVEKRDALELDSEERLTAITARKTETMRDAIAQMHEVETSRAAAEMTKKKYTGLRIKLKMFTEEGASPEEIGEVEAAMTALKVQYAKDKKAIAQLTAQIRATEDAVAKLEAGIEKLRADARKTMAEMMNKVSKSSKLVADYTARIGALESTKQTLCFKVGGFLSANYKSSDADLKPVVRKYRNILAKIQALRVSIHRHRLIAGRDESIN